MTPACPPDAAPPSNVCQVVAGQAVLIDALHFGVLSFGGQRHILKPHGLFLDGGRGHREARNTGPTPSVIRAAAGVLRKRRRARRMNTEDQNVLSPATASLTIRH